jgi:hypothetical protein
MHNLATVLLEFPITVVERAHLSGLEPSGDAVEVEGVLFRMLVLDLANARLVNEHCRFPRLLCTLHSPLKPGWPGTQYRDP